MFSTLSLLLFVLNIKRIGHRPRAHKPCGLHMCKFESAYHTDGSINLYLVLRGKQSFFIIIYVQNWTPWLEPHINSGQLICIRFNLHLMRKLHVKYNGYFISSSWESCFSIAACAIVGLHRPWGLHWNYLEYTYQNHTCTFIADSLENHLLSFSTMQTIC